MKRLVKILENMNFRGRVSVRKRSFGELVYITGGDTREDYVMDMITRKYGNYTVAKSEIIDGVLVIYVN